MKFRKKPVEITARKAKETEYIETLEGIMRADPGDWIITGVEGEEYPCKPDIFMKTYEPVDMEARAAYYLQCKNCRYYNSEKSMCEHPKTGPIEAGPNCYCPRGERK